MDWVQWLTLAGGLAAAAAFVVGRRDTARAHAVDVYVQHTSWQPGPSTETDRALTNYQIVNDSDLPILSAGVTAWDWGRRRLLWRFRRHDRWMTGRRIVGHVFPIISPQSATREDDLPAPPTAWGPPGLPPPITLVFRDGRGRRWVRWPDGRLTRLNPSLYRLEEIVWQRKRRQADERDRAEQVRQQAAERAAVAERRPEGSDD